MWFDLLVVVILLYAIFRGAAKGIVWQLAAIAALVLCFAFAESLSLQVAPLISVKPPLNRWLAMLVIYIGFSFLSFAVARSLRNIIDSMKFTEFDRHLGALLGFLKGTIFCLFLTFFLITISEQARATVLQSYSGHAAAVILNELTPVMPKELHSVLDKYLDKLDHPDVPRHSHEEHSEEVEQGSEGLRNPFFPTSGEGQTEGLSKDGDQKLLQEIITSIPVYLRDELRGQIEKAFDSTSPEDRAEFANQLKSKIPGVLRSVTEEWKNGQPEGDSPFKSDLFNANGNRPTNHKVTLREIAAVYSDYPVAQESLVEEFEDSLSGLPDQIITNVLSDWRIDLLLTEADPDPVTNHTTPLDIRIIRQLELQKVPINSLSQNLRTRLMDAQKR